MMKWVPRIVAVLIGTGVLTIVLVALCAPKKPQVFVMPQDLDTTGMSLVNTDTLYFNVKKPYYGAVCDFDLSPGDRVLVTAEGVYGFDQFYRTRTGDTVGPDGLSLRPKDETSVIGPRHYPMKEAPLGSLLGIIGPKLEYRSDATRAPYVAGNPFFIGSRASFEVPRGVSGKLWFSLNERWLPSSWSDNWGRCTIRISVWRTP